MKSFTTQLILRFGQHKAQLNRAQTRLHRCPLGCFRSTVPCTIRFLVDHHQFLQFWWSITRVFHQAFLTTQQTSSMKFLFRSVSFLTNSVLTYQAMNTKVTSMNYFKMATMSVLTHYTVQAKMKFNTLNQKLSYRTCWHLI